MTAETVTIETIGLWDSWDGGMLDTYLSTKHYNPSELIPELVDSNYEHLVDENYNVIDKSIFNTGIEVGEHFQVVVKVTEPCSIDQNTRWFYNEQQVYPVV